MTLGKKILELRKKKGLSQEALSEIMDVTRQTISNWELDETSPNPEQLKMLSKEFNVSIDELLDNDRIKKYLSAFSSIKGSSRDKITKYLSDKDLDTNMADYLKQNSKK